MNIDSMIQGNPQALVTSYNGVLVADSLEVADRFGKRHTHVLRSIDDLINQLESQSTQNWADYFIPDDYQDNKNRTQRRFKLTRDGFSLLVMGFTGPAALHWKLLYIEAFNKMEQALRSNVDKDQRSNFTFANGALLKKLGVHTAEGALSILLPPGEIVNFAVAVQNASGFGNKAKKKVKDSVKNS